MAVNVAIPDTKDVRRHQVTVVVGGVAPSLGVVATLLLWPGRQRWLATVWLGGVEVATVALVLSTDLLAAHESQIEARTGQRVRLSSSQDTDPTRPLYGQTNLQLELA